jgi:hypothetical protein
LRSAGVSSKKHLGEQILVERQGEVTSMTVIRENLGEPTSIQSTYRGFEGKGQSQEYTTQNNGPNRSSNITPRDGKLSPAHLVDTNRLSTV